MQVAEQLAAARLWAADRAPYLASALFALSLCPAKGLGTAAVDRRWRLYLDPAVCDRWSVEQLGAVLIHEVHHLLRAHSERAETLGVGPAEANRFNIAADCEINDDLADLPLPGVPVAPALYGLATGELAETYYVLLGAAGPLSGAGCGSAATGVPQSFEQVDSKRPAVDGLEAELIRQQVALDVRGTVQAGGHVPSALERWANAFLRPIVDWRRELRAQIRAGLTTVAGAVDYSYARPSRRVGTPLGRSVIFPALVQPLPRVAVVVDTSASMSSSALERALAEIEGLLRSVGVGRASLSVLSCDTAVRSVQRVFNASRVELVGGGGTDLGVGIEAALRLRPRPEVIVVATDGATPWPARPPVVVVVVVIGEGPAPPSWARLVRVPEADSSEAGADSLAPGQAV